MPTSAARLVEYDYDLLNDRYDPTEHPVTKNFAVRIQRRLAQLQPKQRSILQFDFCCFFGLYALLNRISRNLAVKISQNFFTWSEFSAKNYGNFFSSAIGRYVGDTGSIFPIFPIFCCFVGILAR